jgi:PAS domain S-box-containing protein
MLEQMTNKNDLTAMLEADLKTLSKSALLALLNDLPCSPERKQETCPAHRLKLELGIHQFELEAQNQALRESQAAIEESRDRYSELYDFAPVGYMTLDRQGHILELNLTAAAMLGADRANIIGKPLIHWLQNNCHHTFHQHLTKVCGSNQQIMNELVLKAAGDQKRHISIVSRGANSGLDAMPACRSALVDITPLKEKELELTQSHQQLRNLSAHLDRVREYERRHLAREIHDELGQRLTTLRFEVAMLTPGLDMPNPDLSTSAAVLLKQIDETIESVRAIASDLRPAVLDLGLAAAVEWQVQEVRRRTGIACRLKISHDEIGLDNDRATNVFRIVQESLTNIIRHASASEIDLVLEKDEDSLNIQITDNGVGMQESALQKSRSFGIVGMRERVHLLNGSISIISHPGKGAQLKITIPMKERRADANERKINQKPM